MDEITTLLKEAKPLYRKRKLRNKIINLVIVLVIPIMALNTFYQINLQGDDIYLSLQNNDYEEELIEDEFDLY